MLTDPGRVPLGERLWITDQARHALITPDGTIDWFAPGRPGERPVLSRLVDPTGPAVRVGVRRDGSRAQRTLPSGSQSYRAGTLVADTVMDGAGGRIVVTDLLPWTAGATVAPGRILRLVTALSGPVEVEIEVLAPVRVAAAGAVTTWSEGVSWPGVAVRCGAEPAPSPLGRDRPRWQVLRRLDPGESLLVTVDDPDLVDHDPVSVDGAHRLVDDTVAAWRTVTATLVHDGPHRDAVERAALVAVGLADHGGPLSAPTTSLPRWVGGERNEEGRVVRLRHAAGAATTLAAIGLVEPADDAEQWLRVAVEDLALPWPAALDPDGGPTPAAEVWDLAGWRRSEPVVGGRDHGPPDLDALGDVVTAVSASRTGPGSPGGDGPLVAALPALRAAVDWASDHWSEPDAGAWARPAGAETLTASVAQAWVALDAMARLARARNPLDLDAVGWQAESRSVTTWLEKLCLDQANAVVATPAGEGTDAALLRLAWKGPWPRHHPIVAATVDRVLDRLGSAGLVHRLSDEVDEGRPGPDNPDLEASLWAVRALASLDRWEEAHTRLEAVAGLAGAGGLLGAAADPRSGAALGDRPALGVHLALVDAVLALRAGPR